MSKKVLLLIDFQKEWLDAYSEYISMDIKDIIFRTKALINYAEEHNYHIIFTLHSEEPDMVSKNDLIEELYKDDFDVVRAKFKKSPFFDTDLYKTIDGAKEIVVAGVMTSTCMKSTVEDAYDNGFDVSIIRDCCIAFSEQAEEEIFDEIKAHSSEVEFVTAYEFADIEDQEED